MKIGLFFGSFNPIHIGHLIIGNHIAESTDLDQVWFVVSPHNPLKQKSTLLKDRDRLHLVNLAIGDNPKLKVSDIEFGLPQPSYTIDTLAYISEKHPNHQFSLIMGGDNLGSFHKWKNYEVILEHYSIFVYKRSGHTTSSIGKHKNITVLDVPLLDVSASFIRNSIKAGRSVQYLLPDAVLKYVDEMNLYR